MKFLYLILLIISFLHSKQSIIIIDKNSDSIKKFAALELKKHLELVLNQSIPILTDLTNDSFQQIFYVGINPNIKNQISQSNYTIDNNKIYLFGIDKIYKEENTQLETILNMKNSVGTLFSIYDFLYNELNVRWIRPGDEGIVFEVKKSFNFQNKEFSWNSNYGFTILRNDIWNYNKFVNDLNMSVYTPKELHFSKSEVRNLNNEDLLWKRRMKLHITNKPSYGHAFTKYWDKYGRTHPEWFALSESGKRGLNGYPKIDVTNQKFCITNENLQNQIVSNWKKDFKVHNQNVYNACINDMAGYCTCEYCKSHDSKDDEHKNFQEKSKSDRYIYFWNSLLNKTKDFNPNAKVIAYAYSEYRYIPKINRLENGIILGFVPRFFDTPNEIKINLDGWKDKGLSEIFLRPNDFNDDIGLPMGHEKYIYERFKIFSEMNLLGLDYDNAFNFNDWNLEGISRYILIQAFNNPNKSFEELENDYYDIFSNSKNEIKEYYQYWRKIFETKRLPFIKTAGGLENRILLYRNMDKYYASDDFDKTTAILTNALSKAESGTIKKLINKMIISNVHSKLIFETYTKKNDISKLIDYRIKHKDELSLCWPQVFRTEVRINGNYFKKAIYKILDNF